MKNMGWLAKLAMGTGLLAALAPGAFAGMKGVGTNPGSYLPAAINNLNVSWWYNWASSKNGASGNGEYIPMFWGASNVNTNELNAAGASGATAVFTFNEPDNPGQSNMSVAQAISLWPQIQTMAKAHHMLIGAPSAGNYAPGGWLDQFLQQARSKGYEVDFINLHPYVGDSTVAASVTDLQNKLVSAHNYFNLPIWITEYAMADFSRSGDPYFGQATEAQYATQSVAMLHTLPYVQRYAWLAAIPSIGGYTDTATCTSTGANTQVGVAYAAAGGSTGGGGIAPSTGVHPLPPGCAPGSRLDDNAAGTTNGNKIQIWASNGSQAQNWNFASVGTNTWNLAVNLGPYCLDGGAAKVGTPTQLWSCNGSADQGWVSASAAQSGAYNFASKQSGLCLDVSGGGSANGTVVQSYTCNGSSAQAWYIH